jgi:hypothetical protein
MAPVHTRVSAGNRRSVRARDWFPHERKKKIAPARDASVRLWVSPPRADGPRAFARIFPPTFAVARSGGA